MGVNFLHGIESINVPDGKRSIRVIKTAVIGLIGTAPIHAAKTPANPHQIAMVNSPRESALKCGPMLSGYTIPEALSGIFDHGNTEVLVINVFDPAVHREAVTGEAVTFSMRGAAQLKYDVLEPPAITSVDGATRYTAAVDYTWHPSGALKRLPAGAIPQAGTVKADYTRGAPEKVTPADIIGAFDSEAASYTGLQQYQTAYSRFGFFPKILIAPGFSELRSISGALEALAYKIRAIAYIDAPVGLTCQQAIELRGSDAPSAFQTASPRLGLCYPRLNVHDPATDSTRLEAYSARRAGLRAQVDREEGYWVSESNHEIRGITGVECLLTARLNDADTDVNRLNEAGITTVFNSFGTGYRCWGNRSAAWPSDPHPRNFLCVQRTEDMVKESIEFSMLQFLDRPINRALIDSIAESVNGFIRTLIGRGALLGGTCWFDPDANPDHEIALGHLTFQVDLMPPTPGERLTFEYYLDTRLLQQRYGMRA